MNLRSNCTKNYTKVQLKCIFGCKSDIKLLSERERTAENGNNKDDLHTDKVLLLRSEKCDDRYCKCLVMDSIFNKYSKVV